MKIYLSTPIETNGVLCGSKKQRMISYIYQIKKDGTTVANFQKMVERIRNKECLYINIKELNNGSKN